MAQSDRLPVLTSAMVLESVRFEAFRDQFGMLQCAQRGVGPMRRKLGPAPANIDAKTLAALTPEELARDGARVVLTGMCCVCPLGACKMKRWGMD